MLTPDTIDDQHQHYLCASRMSHVYDHTHSSSLVGSSVATTPESLYLHFSQSLTPSPFVKWHQAMRRLQHSDSVLSSDQVSKRMDTARDTAVSKDISMCSVAMDFTKTSSDLRQGCSVFTTYLYASNTRTPDGDGGPDGRSRHLADAVSSAVFLSLYTRAI